MDRVFHALSSAGGGSSTAAWAEYGPGHYPPLKQGISSLFGWYAIALNIVNLTANIYFGMRDFDNTESSSKPVMLAFAAMALFALISQTLTEGTATQYILSVFNICANLMIGVVVMSVVKGEFFWSAEHFRRRDLERAHNWSRKASKRPLLGDPESQTTQTLQTGAWEKFWRGRWLWSLRLWSLGLFNISKRRDQKAAEAAHFADLANEVHKIEAAEARNREQVAAVDALFRRETQALSERVKRPLTLQEKDHIRFQCQQLRRSEKHRITAQNFRRLAELRAQRVSHDLRSQVELTLGGFMITTLCWGIGAFQHPGPHSYNLDESPYERMKLGAAIRPMAAYFFAWFAFVAMIIGRNYQYWSSWRARGGNKIDPFLRDVPDLLDQAADAFARGKIGNFKTRDGATKFFVLYVGTCVDNFLSAISLFATSTDRRFLIFQLPNILAGLVSSLYDFILLYQEIRRIYLYGFKDEPASKAFFDAYKQKHKEAFKAVYDPHDPEKTQYYGIRNQVRQLKAKQKARRGRAAREGKGEDGQQQHVPLIDSDHEGEGRENENARISTDLSREPVPADVSMSGGNGEGSSRQPASSNTKSSTSKNAQLSGLEEALASLTARVNDLQALLEQTRDNAQQDALIAQIRQLQHRASSIRSEVASVHSARASVHSHHQGRVPDELAPLPALNFDKLHEWPHFSLEHGRRRQRRRSSKAGYSRLD